MAARKEMLGESDGCMVAWRCHLVRLKILEGWNSLAAWKLG
jgi:hypothetical protein